MLRTLVLILLFGAMAAWALARSRTGAVSAGGRAGVGAAAVGGGGGWG